MAVATIGAFALAIYEKSGDYNEAIAVMLFYQIGELFQSYAVGKSRKNISALMDIRPDYANIEQDGQLVQVDPDEVAIGTVIVVQPGEKVPIDGIITEGTSTLNTSALTGESLPRDAREGDEIISGCINMTGLLKIRTTKAFGESTVSKILELVENSSSRKSRSEDFIAKFARIYTPAVCYSALALAVLPPVIRLVGGMDGQWEQWIYRALTFLVTSCPCALVVSIPLSFFAGIGGASKEGVLIKGSNYLETLSQVKCVVFDKTGTLTQRRVRGHRRPSQRDGRGQAAGVRGAGRVRLLPPHQQEPAAGLRQAHRPQPRHRYSRSSAATASPPRWTAYPSPPATASSWSSWASPTTTATASAPSSTWPWTASTPVTSSSPTW